MMIRNYKAIPYKSMCRRQLLFLILAVLLTI
jgi:hypothetical protein